MLTNTSLPQISHQQLSKILGQSFSESESFHYLKQVKYITPKVGKFWQTTNSEACLYVILSGKVRVLDLANNLITTLEKGASFGESTFFPQENLTPYSIRTSVNVKLAYFSSELLLPLMSKYPLVIEHFRRRAQERILLLTNRENNREQQLNSVLSTTDKTNSKFYLDKPSHRCQNHSSVQFPQPAQKITHLFHKVTRRYPFFAQQSRGTLL